MIERLKSRGLLPAVIVSVVLAAAFAVPTFGAVHTFITTAYPQCSGVTITASPTTVTQSSSGGTHVTATASATGCGSSPRYEFWLRPASDPNWQMVQSYGTSNTYDWNSTGAAAGTVYLGVHAKDVNSTAAYDAVASTPVTVSAVACGTVTITPAPTSVNNNPNAGGGTHVIATAAASGSTCAAARYEFWIRAATSSTWQMVQAYSATATYNWDTSGAAPGIVYVGVHAKDASSTAPAGYDSVASSPVTVNASQCTGVTITASPTTVVHSTSGGTHVTATAVATGCTNAARYEFWIRPASSSTWQLVQGYSATATYDWNSTGAAVGTVYLGVHVKDVNSVSSAGYDVVASTAVTVT